MDVAEIKHLIPVQLYNSFEKRGIQSFLPAQSKAIAAGLVDSEKNLLISTPTGSGKTVIAELAALKGIYENVGKAIYIAPLKALATEKYNEFKDRYPDIKIALSIGDTDAADNYLEKFDLILTTSEKLDSEIRHDATWLKNVKTVIIDEIHLLNDASRGPTLEIIITILKQILGNIRLIGLSATIGNPEELAAWLDATLVQDSWRPVELKKGIYRDGEVTFYEPKKK
jgi:helicase